MSNSALRYLWYGMSMDEARHKVRNKVTSIRNYPRTTAMYTILGMVCGYKAYVQLVDPYMRRCSEERVLETTLKFEHGHNERWGLRVNEGKETPDRNAYYFGYTPLEKPQLVWREQSEAFPDSDVAVMEVRDVDEVTDDTVYFRSMHFLQHRDNDDKQEKKKKLTSEERRKQAARERASTNVQGFNKCVALTPSNNCVMDIRYMGVEYIRKMITALALGEVLRDPGDRVLPSRLTEWKELDKHVCVVGLGSGMLPMLLHYNYSGYKVDVVEKDPTVVEVARKLMGFRTPSGMTLYNEDISNFVRSEVIRVEKGKQKVKQRVFEQMVNPNGLLDYETDKYTGASMASKYRQGRYDMMFLDCMTPEGTLPSCFQRLDFITNVYRVLSQRGIAVLAIPRDNPRVLETIVGNWRKVFDDRSVVLMHSKTSNHTVMMTFKDQMEQGEASFGQVVDWKEMRELMHAYANAFKGRLPMEFSKEIEEDTFQQIVPGQQYRVMPVDTKV